MRRGADWLPVFLYPMFIRIICLILFACILLPGIQLHAQLTKRGRCEIADDSGNVSRGRCKNYLQEGKWRTYYGNGHLKSEGVYHEGLYEGKHISYYEDGRISSIIYYSKGKHHGPFILLNENGDTIENRYFEMDVPDGRFYNSLHGITTTGNFVNGKKEGWWIVIYQATRDSVYFVQGKGQGRAVSTHNGSIFLERTFLDNQLNGPLKKFDENGMLTTEQYYKKGHLDSVSRTFEGGKLWQEQWYSNGQPYKHHITYFPGSDSIAHAIYFYSPGKVKLIANYSSPGVPRQMTWWSDRMTDSVYNYDQNGKLQIKIIYSCRPSDSPLCLGDYTEYKFYPNGQLEHSGFIDDGRKDGPWKYFDTTGTLVKQVKHDMRSGRAPYVYYYPNGKPKLVAVLGGPNGPDSVQIFSPSGKSLKMGSPLYDRALSEVDSSDTDVSFILPPPFELFIQAPQHAEEEIFTLVEEIPEFPGGNDSMIVFLKRNLRYPPMEKDAGISGTVYVGFVVDKDGSLVDIHMEKENRNAPGFSKEAIRVVKLMPKWKPGKMHGRPVKVKMILPIRFILE